MKKQDIVLLAGILAIALTVYLGLRAIGASEGACVRITAAGVHFGDYPLDEDCVVEIGDGNVLEIAGGTARMKEADCPDQLCVHQKAVSRNKESIVCLPNQVVVQVFNDGQEAQVDAVALLSAVGEDGLG